MALKLTSKKRFILEFENEDGKKNEESEVPIACQIHRLKMTDLFDVQNRLSGMAKDGQAIEDVATNLEDPVQAQQFWEIATFVISTYTSDWENVELDDQPLITGEQVISELGPEDVDKVASVFFKALNVSGVSNEEVKNSVPDSDPESLESGSTAPSA
jgi:hypothetical protein